MDYSKMSDFEINAAVFESLHGGYPDHKEGDGGAMVLISYEGGVVGGDAVEVEVERGVFNPCNNVAEAWPIIVERKINIEWHEWKNSEWKSYALNNATTKSYYDTNPLRAAMIVFLMMQELLNVPANSAGSDLR